jgi:hypothetical protein
VGKRRFRGRSPRLTAEQREFHGCLVRVAVSFAILVAMAGAAWMDSYGGWLLFFAGLDVLVVMVVAYARGK